MKKRGVCGGRRRLTEGRQLGVPGQGVATEALAVGLGLLENRVGLGEGELALLGLCHFPLLRVLGREDAELVFVGRDGLVRRVVEVSCLCCRAKVQLARGDHE